MMAQLMDGTDNVYVLGVKDDGVIPATTPDAVDDMLETSLALQLTQINDFIEELGVHEGRAETLVYGSFMKHLQGECVFHLSALAAAAIMELKKARKFAEAEYERGNTDGYNDGLATGMEMESDR